jgi:hypothetical protein
MLGLGFLLASILLCTTNFALAWLDSRKLLAIIVVWIAVAYGFYLWQNRWTDEAVRRRRSNARTHRGDG